MDQKIRKIWKPQEALATTLLMKAVSSAYVGIGTFVSSRKNPEILGVQV